MLTPSGDAEIPLCDAEIHWMVLNLYADEFHLEENDANIH
jgi:hypothetical protein